jgi:hypothetical protein
MEMDDVHLDKHRAIAWTGIIITMGLLVLLTVLMPAHALVTTTELNGIKSLVTAHDVVGVTIHTGGLLYLTGYDYAGGDYANNSIPYTGYFYDVNGNNITSVNLSCTEIIYSADSGGGAVNTLIFTNLSDKVIYFSLNPQDELYCQIFTDSIFGMGTNIITIPSDSAILSTQTSLLWSPFQHLLTIFQWIMNLAEIAYNLILLAIVAGLLYLGYAIISWIIGKIADLIHGPASRK